MVDKKANGHIQELQKKVEDMENNATVQIHLTMGVIRMITEMLHVQESLAKAWRAQLTEAGFGINEEGGPQNDIKQ